MSLNTTEEAQVRLLLEQQAALLSLAASEPTIISKLAAAKISLADLTAASSLNAADLLLVRQGTQEKSATGTVIKSFAQDGAVLTTGNQTIAGTKTFSAAPVIPNAAIATNPVALGQYVQSLASSGYQKLPSGLIIQWYSALLYTRNTVGTTDKVSFPIAFPNDCFTVSMTTVDAFTNDGSVIFGASEYSNSQSQSTFIRSGTSSSYTAFFIAIGY